MTYSFVLHRDLLGKACLASQEEEFTDAFRYKAFDQCRWLEDFAPSHALRAVADKDPQQMKNYLRDLLRHRPDAEATLQRLFPHLANSYRQVSIVADIADASEAMLFKCTFGDAQVVSWPVQEVNLRGF